MVWTLIGFAHFFKGFSDVDTRNGLWLKSKCIYASHTGCYNKWFQTKNDFNLMEVCHSLKVKNGPGGGTRL